jgi:hypothetical protein
VEVLVKKRENEARLLESYIVSKKKFTIIGKSLFIIINILNKIEYIKLRFFRIYKNNVILKLYNQNSVIAYKPVNITQGNSLGNEGKIEVKRITDVCGFENTYCSQSKRDEFFLNFKDRLYISMKTSVFCYDYKTNIMSQLGRLNEDHKGGSFIYVPYMHSIYCVSGLMSIMTERLKLGKTVEQIAQNKWEVVNKLVFPRGYYSSFVQNDCKIYIMLGFNLWDNEFLTTVDKLDTSDPNPEWKTLKIEGKSPPKLTFSTCVPIADEEVYILGGKDENNNDCGLVYSYDIRQGTIEDSNMRLPLPNHIENSQEAHESRNLFYQENSFIALRQQESDYENSFLMGLFDSKNYLHLVNIRNFDYSFVVQNIQVGLDIDDDSDREQISDEEMETEHDKIKLSTSHNRR